MAFLLLFGAESRFIYIMTMVIFFAGEAFDAYLLSAVAYNA